MENIIRIKTEEIEYLVGAVVNEFPNATARLIEHEGEESIFVLRTTDIQVLFNVGAEFGRQRTYLKAIEMGLKEKTTKQNSRQGK